MVLCHDIAKKQIHLHLLRITIYIFINIKESIKYLALARKFLALKLFHS